MTSKRVGGRWGLPPCPPQGHTCYPEITGTGTVAVVDRPCAADPALALAVRLEGRAVGEWLGLSPEVMRIGSEATRVRLSQP